MQSLTAGSLMLIAIGAAAVRLDAHKAITSKYTYNDDVFPIVRDKCARCHVPGGVAPMSLVTYEDAIPWGESIRAELVASHMPPAIADEGFNGIRRVHSLTPHESDVLLTWATGGNPRGAVGQVLPKIELKNLWSLGAPDVAVALPSTFELAADETENTRDFAIATGTTEARWVRAVDLLPGTPSIVRSAVVFLKDAPDRVLARWLPGQDLDQPDDAAFRLPAGAELVARIHYKKTWQFEGKLMADRSTVGIYFAKAASERELDSVPLATGPIQMPLAKPFTFSQTIGEDVQALALSPDQVPDNLTLQVEAVHPDGSRAPMIRFATRSDWNRRYWFAAPIALPRGTRIEVTVRFDNPELIAAAFGAPSNAGKAVEPLPLKLALDVVRLREKPTAP